MSRVARSRRKRGAVQPGPAAVPCLPKVPEQEGVPPPLPGAVEQQRQRVLTAVLDVARIGLSVLVRRVAQELTLRPRQCTLAALEGEVRDAVLALGAALLTHLVRLRGTGDLGPAYTCPCGVRLVRKEIAPLQQRTWCGPVTLERAVYAGAACPVRAHHVPLDAAWGLLQYRLLNAYRAVNQRADWHQLHLGTGGASLGLQPSGTRKPLLSKRYWGVLGATDAPPERPDPDGGTLAPAAPGTGPARLAPGFAAGVVAFGARRPYGEAAHLLEVAFGAVARLAPNTVRASTRAAGRVRQRQEETARARTIRARPPSRAQVREVVRTPVGDPPAGAPATLVVSMDGALERTRQGWKEVKLGAIAALAARGTASTAPVLGAVTSTATLAPAHAFGTHLLAAAQRRGLGWAQQVVVLGDGAKWIWELAARRFPRATEIVDWYHAQQHLWALAHLLYGEGSAAAWTWRETLAGELWAAQTPDDVAVLAHAADEAWAAQTPDDVAVLAHAADEAWAAPRKDLPDGTPRRTKARHRDVGTAAAYFTTNAGRMRYGAFRAQGAPVGSGVVEGGCQNVLHARPKRPGAHWDVDSAEDLVRARAVLCSRPAPRCSHPHDQLAC